MNTSNERLRAVIAYNETFRDIVVNPLESFIVWSKDETNPAIIKANQDGSGRKVLIDKDLYKPYSIVINYETKRIYFLDYSSLGGLSSIDFNGDDRKLILRLEIDGSNYSTKFLDIYDGNLYVYNPESYEIIKVSTNGHILNKTEISKDIILRTIKIIHSSRQPKGVNKCIDSNCTHLCLPNEYTSDKFKCIYTEKQYLFPGEKYQSVRN